MDKLTGVIVTYLTFVLPFCVWTLRGFMLGVPRELEEAAMVDGSTRFGAFVRILLPLVAPGLVATSIFAFIQVWNEFIIAYVLLQSQDKQTLHRLARVVHDAARHRVGAADGGGVADRAAGRRLLRARAPADRVRADRRRRPRMSARAARRAACLLPGFDGLEAAGRAAALDRRAGSAASFCSARTSATREQVARADRAAATPSGPTS